MVQVEHIEDPSTVSWLGDILREAGYSVVASSSGVHLAGVGSQHGDRSVDLDVEVLVLDDVRVLRFRSRLRSKGGVFEAAALAATRGNRATIVPRFEVDEILVEGTSVFHVSATLFLYADHVSDEELITMMGIFLHEVDSIDNELVSIIEEGSTDASK